jgi:hypothetical protein
MTRRTKPFKVAAVSSNTNSFGLTGLILIAQDGEAWQVGASQHHVKTRGEIVQVPVLGENDRNFACLGFEIPERLSQAPPVVVAEVWAVGKRTARRS